MKSRYFQMVILGTCASLGVACEMGATSAEALNHLGVPTEPATAHNAGLKKLHHDEWYVPADNIAFVDTEKLAECIAVRSEKLASAISRLEHRQFQSLSAEDTREYIDRASGREQGDAFLIRSFSTNNSSAEIRTRGPETYLWFGYLGSLSSVRKHPCVAHLPYKPDEIRYVVSGAL